MKFLTSPPSFEQKGKVAPRPALHYLHKQINPIQLARSIAENSIAIFIDFPVLSPQLHSLIPFVFTSHVWHIFTINFTATRPKALLLFAAVSFFLLFAQFIPFLLVGFSLSLILSLILVLNSEASSARSKVRGGISDHATGFVLLGFSSIMHVFDVLFCSEGWPCSEEMLAQKCNVYTGRNLYCIVPGLV